MGFEIGKWLDIFKFDPDSDDNSRFLPVEMEEPTIAKMNDGQVGYTLPWAMFANEDRSLWINGSYPVYNQTGGTVQMRIKRQGNYILVDKRSIGDRKYQPRGASFVGSVESDFIPVKLVNLR